MLGIAPIAIEATPEEYFIPSPIRVTTPTPLPLVSGFTIIALGVLVIPISQLLQFTQLFLPFINIIAIPALIILSAFIIATFLKHKTD